MNTVELIGVVDEETYRDNISQIYFLNVKRISGVIDRLKISINLFEFEILENIIGKTISIKGELKTRNVKSNNRTHLDTFVEVQDMELIEDLDQDSYGLNIVQLTGVICIKNSLRESPSGRILMDCCLAVNRENGQSSYIPIILWGNNAKLLDNYEIGTKLELIGRFQSRNYTKNLDTKTTYEVSVQTMHILD